MSAASVPVAPPDEWVTGRHAKAALGCHQAGLMRLVVIGQIRVRNDPGVPPRYHRGDVARVARIRRAAPPRRTGAGA
jgi:hypothetical protein